MNNELCQKVHIQVSVSELHIDTLNKHANGISMASDEK